MKKLLIALAIAGALVSCSESDEDSTETRSECLAELCYKLVPEYGMLHRILAFDSSFTDYPNSVTYEIIYHNNPVEIEYHMSVCDKLGIEFKYSNEWRLWSETLNDKIEFAEDGAYIICRCNDRIEKAKRIYKRFNTTENKIAENLY